MQHTVSPPAPTLEDFSALLARGREIKERRMREARQKWEAPPTAKRSSRKIRLLRLGMGLSHEAARLTQKH